ncbi:hypothetical protein DMP07_02170 [Slackia faecicanis]|uniref:Uncharacterized protein n=1 Tax=Slackia faecicanis TaxID=255723 RepID=A0A3N0AHZ5_9ACTN|nr:hypothetical protein [Slackia faecicanis]RNL21656.1 hypothetical protein DMP07_02170 [Slackia faecicanis]
MGNRGTHPYVEGTAALKIGRLRPQGEPRLIRVDFGATNRPVVQEGLASRADCGPRVMPLERASRRCARCAAPLRGDAAVIVDALGLREMRDELERGTASGVASEGSFAVTLACCAALFAFCLFLLAW